MNEKCLRCWGQYYWPLLWLSYGQNVVMLLWLCLDSNLWLKLDVQMTLTCTWARFFIPSYFCFLFELFSFSLSICWPWRIPHVDCSQQVLARSQLSVRLLKCIVGFMSAEERSRALKTRRAERGNSVPLITRELTNNQHKRKPKALFALIHDFS